MNDNPADLTSLPINVFQIIIQHLEKNTDDKISILSACKDIYNFYVTILFEKCHKRFLPNDSANNLINHSYSIQIAYSYTLLFNKTKISSSKVICKGIDNTAHKKGNFSSYILKSKLFNNYQTMFKELNSYNLINQLIHFLEKLEKNQVTFCIAGLNRLTTSNLKNLSYFVNLTPTPDYVYDHERFLKHPLSHGQRKTNSSLERLLVYLLAAGENELAKKFINHSLYNQLRYEAGIPKTISKAQHIVYLCIQNLNDTAMIEWIITQEKILPKQALLNDYILKGFYALGLPPISVSFELECCSIDQYLLFLKHLPTATIGEDLVTLYNSRQNIIPNTQQTLQAYQAHTTLLQQISIEWRQRRNENQYIPTLRL